MMHQRSLQGYTIDQRGPHSYSINQRVHGCTTYQQNLTKHHTQKYSWGSMAQQQQDYSKVPKVQFDDYHDETNGVAHDDTNAKPASHYNREYNNNLICPNVSDAKTVENDNCKDSLFPHGDPLPYDYLSDWDQRPECPRPKWTHPENPSWQPPIKSRTGEYSGTELVSLSLHSHVINVLWIYLTNRNEEFFERCAFLLVISVEEHVQKSIIFSIYQRPVNEVFDFSDPSERGSRTVREECAVQL